MRVGRDDRRAVRRLGRQVDLVELARPAERRAADLDAADRQLLVVQRGCGPTPRSASGSGARRDRCRRAATPARRRLPTQTCRASASVSSSLMLLVPSLKPIRLRGVACARLVVDVRPKPSCDQRITMTPRPMRARLRTAWNATCGSSAHAWTQRSPPERSGSSDVAGERRQLHERGRPAPVEPEATALEEASARSRR